MARLALPVSASGLIALTPHSTRVAQRLRPNGPPSSGEPALSKWPVPRLDMGMNIRNLAQAVLCAGVASLAALAATAGIFVRGDGTVITFTTARGGTYDVAATGVYAYNAQRVVAEGIGWDVFTLLVVVPAALIAAIFVARGTFRGRLVAAGLLGYFLYMYLEYSVTWAFGPLFLVHVLTAALSVVGLVWMSITIAGDAVELAVAPKFPFRSWAVLATAMSALLGVMWLGRIVGAGATKAAADAALMGETTMTVQALDLALVLPTLLISAYLAWHRTAAGEVVGAVVAVTFTAMAAAITSMLLSAGIVNGEFEWPPIVIFGVAAITGVVIAWRMYSALSPRLGAVQRMATAPSPA